MKLHVIFKQENIDFNVDHANEHHNGNESDDNRKDHWYTTHLVKGDIDEVNLIENGEYNLSGRLSSGMITNVSLPEMTILECYKDNNLIASYVASKKLIKKTHKTHNERDNTTQFYFHFKPQQDFIQLGVNTYVAEKDLPKELTNFFSDKK